MGTYIIVGPCYRFDVNVKGLNDEKREEVRKNASTFIDIDAFNCSVENDIMSFTAKEELFLDGFIEIVKRQYEMWGTSESTRGEESILANLEKAKDSVDKLVSLAEGCLSPNFQHVEDWWYVKYGYNGTCDASVYMINLFMVGKAWLECFIRFFSGIEKFIKLDCPVPASRFMKVILTN